MRAGMYPWMMRRALVWPIVLLACGPRPPEGSASDGASTDATGSTGAPTTGPMTTDAPTTTDPTTTGPTTAGPTSTTDPGTSTSTSTGTDTTTSTTDPLTGGTSSTGTTDVSTSGDTSGTSGGKLDLPEPPPDSAAGLILCTQDAPPGTALTGMTKQGPFEGDRAYFGYLKLDGELVSPTFMFLSPGAGTWELWEQIGGSGPIIHGIAFTDPFNAWLGDWAFDGEIKTNMGGDPIAIKVEITGFAGTWEMSDPSDPPRLLGNVTGEVAGPFDAVFCNNLNIIPPP